MHLDINFRIYITLFKEYAPPHIIPIACRVHNFFLVKLYLVNYVGVHIFLVKLYNIYSICSLGAYFLVCNCAYFFQLSYTACLK